MTTQVPHPLNFYYWEPASKTPPDLTKANLNDRLLKNTGFQLLAYEEIGEEEYAGKDNWGLDSYTVKRQQYAIGPYNTIITRVIPRQYRKPRYK